MTAAAFKAEFPEDALAAHHRCELRNVRNDLRAEQEGDVAPIALAGLLAAAAVRIVPVEHGTAGSDETVFRLGSKISGSLFFDRCVNRPRDYLLRPNATFSRSASTALDMLAGRASAAGPITEGVEQAFDELSRRTEREYERARG